MANLKSLKPFQKGYDPRRNTKGRPVATWDSWKDAIDKELKKKIPTKYGDVSVEMAIILKLMERARAGHLPSMKILMNYSYGKPVSYCARCERRREQALAILEERRREEELRHSKEEKKRIAREMKEVDEWIEGWFPKNKKKK